MTFPGLLLRCGRITSSTWWNAAHCRSRQRLHRTIDVALIGLSTVSIAAFLFALAVIHHVQPLQHWPLVHMQLHDTYIALTLQAAAVAGLMVSLLIWVVVAITTPAPVYLRGSGD